MGENSRGCGWFRRYKTTAQRQSSVDYYKEHGLSENKSTRETVGWDLYLMKTEISNVQLDTAILLKKNNVILSSALANRKTTILLWCFQTVVLEKTLESPLESREIKPVNPKGKQCWVLFGRTDAEAKTPILWPPDVNSWLIGKDLDAWKDCRQKEKRGTKDEMDGWHYWFNGHELGQTPGDGEGQRSLACCSPWNGEKLDKICHLSNNNNWLIRVLDAWNTAYHVVWLLENSMTVNSTQCIDPQTVTSVSVLSEWQLIQTFSRFMWLSVDVFANVCVY